MTTLPTHRAQDLAPEIVGQILSHLVELYRRERSPLKKPRQDDSPRHSALSTASLISQTWREPAQRLLFESLMVRWGFEAEWIRGGLVGSGGLGEHVRELRIKSFYKDLTVEPTLLQQIRDDNAVTEEHLVDLLLLLPGLRTLALKHVGFKSSGRDRGEQNISLENLKTLEVASAPFDATLDLTRSLLRLTPNLETLILNPNRSPDVDVRLQGLSSPIAIPSLHTLVFKGNNYGSLLPTLLSSETLLGIPTLSLEGVHSDHERITALKLGPNVTRVVHLSLADDDTTATIYSHLPRLQEVGYYLRNRYNNAVPEIPSTVDTPSFASAKSAYEVLEHLREKEKWPSALRRIKIPAPPMARPIWIN